MVVCWCRPEQQLERLAGTRAFASRDARRRIAAQMPIDEKRRLADEVIDCSGTMRGNPSGRSKLVLEKLKQAAASGRDTERSGPSAGTYLDRSQSVKGLCDETSKNNRRAIRLLAIGLIIGLGAYWAGSRYGQHNPASGGALSAGRRADETPTASTPLKRKMSASTSRPRRPWRTS